MRAPHRFPLTGRAFRGLVPVVSLALVVGWAGPAAALAGGATTSGAAVVASLASRSTAAAVVAPMCQIGSPESITGVQFVNGQFDNGTWTYSTGAACTSNVADMALYEELDFNGTKV